MYLLINLSLRMATVSAMSLIRFLAVVYMLLYTSFIHHKGRSNNETNKQAEKKRKNLTKLN